MHSLQSCVSHWALNEETEIKQLGSFGPPHHIQAQTAFDTEAPINPPIHLFIGPVYCRYNLLQI
jgi:hypothetical protein